MKKLFYTVMAFAALFVSCSKENTSVNTEDSVLIPKSFKVVSPETKTALDGVSIKWSANDEICVIAATTGNKYTFEIDPTDAGKASATFTGSIDAADESETTFYAVYPNQTIRSVSGGIIEFDKRLNNENGTQTAIAGGFDPAYSVMVATSDASGTFAFSHRSAFLKLTIGNDNVSSINIKSSSTRFYGRPKVPIADTDKNDLSKYSIEGAVDNITIGGSLIKGSTYFVPVTLKDSKLGNITLTCTYNDGTPTKKLTATNWKNNTINAGKIYDLGTPVFAITPELSVDNVTIESNVTSGSVPFSVVGNKVGTKVSYTLSADGLSNATWNSISYDNTTGDGSISFTCDENTDDTNAKTATIHLVLKDSSDNILDETDVTITQKKKGAATVFEWNMNDISTISGISATSFSVSRTSGGITYSLSYEGTGSSFTAVSGVNVLRFGGKYSTSNKRIITIPVTKAGTLTIVASHNGSGTTGRPLAIDLDGTNVSSVDAGSCNKTSPGTFNVPISGAGTITIYPSGGDLYVFSVSYTI